VKEGFEFAAKTGYGRTVSNIQGKGIPNDGAGTDYRVFACPVRMLGIGISGD